MKPILITFFFLIPMLISAQDKVHKKVLKLMGSRFEITVIEEDETVAWNAINAAIEEIERIEALISSWDPNSQTSALNQNAGLKPLKVDSELYQLVSRAKKISILTNGAFDISYASMDKIWKFDGTMNQVPDKIEVAQSVEKIDFNRISLNKELGTVYLEDAGMKIGFGAIGKGYAANRGRLVMQDLGIKNGIVNAGGDLMAWGTDEYEKPWRVAIADPKDKGQAIGWLNIQNMSVVTSGNYEKFVVIDNEKYSHIIDPRTGYPVKGLKSVTIVCPDAELADALATSVFVMGKTNGLELVNTLADVECIIVDDKDQLTTSENLTINYYE